MNLAEEEIMNNALDKTIEDKVGLSNLLESETFISNLEKEFSLTDEQRIILDGEITLFIIAQKTEEGSIKDIEEHLSLNTEKEVVGEIIFRIRNFYEKKLTPLFSQSPSNLLELTNRLNQASVITPLKQTNTLNESAPTVSSEITTKPSIDPYHEQIEP